MNRISRNVLNDNFLGFDLFPDFNNSTYTNLYKSTFFMNFTGSATSVPAVNNTNYAFIGSIVGSAGVSLFYNYSNSSSNNNIFFGS